MSSTTRGNNTRYGNFNFQLNPVGLKSGANPNKYQPRNYNDILNSQMGRSQSRKTGRTLSGLRKAANKSQIAQKR